MIHISESLCTFGGKRQPLVSGTKDKQRRKKRKRFTAFILENKVFTGDGATFSVSVLILRNKYYRINSSHNFQPPASSKVDYDKTFMLPWKAVRRSGNCLFSLQNFYNHIQELALFGALSTRQPSKSTTNVLPLCCLRMI